MAVEQLSIADVLSRMADLIEPEGAWTQGWFAKDAVGYDVDADDDDAICWCVRGAALRVVGAENLDEQKVFASLRSVLGAEEYDSIEIWNDSSETTQAEVVSKLREAAALAKASGK